MPVLFPYNNFQSARKVVGCELGNEPKFDETVFRHGRLRARGFFCPPT